jgi:hypothetical protein
MELPKTLIYVYELSMDNKLLGVIIIGFGILVLFSDQEYNWIVSAAAVGIGSGFLIRKEEKDDIEK